MTKTFDRYLARALMGGMVTVLGFLVMLISLAVLVAELKDVGKGDYGMVDALLHVGLTGPALALDMLGVSALVGGMLGIGSLAAREEITALRAAGISPRRMVGSALFAALPLMVGAAALAEYGVPQTLADANRRKRVAEAGRDAVLTEDDLWLRGRDAILRIGAVVGDGRLDDLEVFSFNDARFLVRVLRADRARIEGDGTWSLEGVVIEDLSSGGRREFVRHREIAAIDAEQLRLIVFEEDMAAPSHYWHRAHFATDPNERRDAERRFWKAAGAILAIGALMMLSIPLEIGSGLVTSRGRRLIVGSVLGALVQVLVQAVHFLGDILDLDPRLVGLAPAGLALLGTAALLARLR